MKKIFEPVNLGKLQLKNRILRSATLTDKDSAAGAYLPYEAESCAALAKNNVACIITGMIGVGVNSSAADFAPRADNETFPERFKQVTDAVHENGGKIVAQLCHSGANAMLFEQGDSPWAPSAMTSMMGFDTVEMTKEQIATVVKDFADAALICKEAGADGVQLHCAHAYLLSQFLSPYYNHRTDEYGGALENRARISFEVYDAVREKVGKDFPVLVKINFDDLIGLDGTCGEDCVWVCKELEKRGIDAIEVSSGLAIDRESRPMQKAVEGALTGHFTEGALKVSQEVGCPVISVGGYRTKEQIENVLNMGNIAAISMSRPFANPEYIVGWDK